MLPTTVVSAPGKVLLAGGYLILDPTYSGLVVATSSRFYSVLRPGQTPHHIHVRSPQFVDAAWTYEIALDSSARRVSATQTASPSGSTNKFVQIALEETLSFVVETNGGALPDALSQGIDVVIAGDNDFYSQQEQLQKLGLPPGLASLSKLPHFAPTGVTLADVSKTGLGSSAALITSLVAALLVHCNVVPASALNATAFDQASQTARATVHNLAQFVHCLAQGKVGSGFDVASAVFGSQIYTRFNPAIIQPLMDEPRAPLAPVIDPRHTAWDHVVRPFTLPPHTRILLADIHAGSNTPLLVSQVLKWRKDNPQEAHALWSTLDQLNMSFAATLDRLSELHKNDTDAYLKTVRYISSLQPRQWLANPNMEPNQVTCLEAFYEAHLLSEQIRGKMRDMGRLSGVEIEPPQQTQLLDGSVSLAGVIGGGVPGAGGYDAIWLLVLDPPEGLPDMPPVSRIDHVWSDIPGVTPLLAEESKRMGVCVEALDDIPGLKSLVAT